MQQTELTQQFKISAVPAGLQHTKSVIARKAQNIYMPCSDEIFKEEKAAVAGSLPACFLSRTAQAIAWNAVLSYKDHDWNEVF